NDSIIDAGTTYYADFGDPSCTVRIPVKVGYNVPKPEVTPTSCLKLGNNVYFIESSDLGSPIDIKINKVNGDPFDKKIIWSPASLPGFKYYYPGLPPQPMPSQSTQGALPFILNHVEIPLDPMQVQTLHLHMPDGYGCKDESITLIAGGLNYNDYCYGDAKTLNDVYSEFSNLLNHKQVVWYDSIAGGTSFPGHTTVTPGETYYADFGI